MISTTPLLKEDRKDEPQTMKQRAQTILFEKFTRIQN
jgi:hypothetical protein